MDFLEQMKQILECDVCSKVKENHKQWPSECQHSICVDCFEELENRDSSDERIQCPVDKCTKGMPREKLASLKVNKDKKKLFPLMESLSSSTTEAETSPDKHPALVTKTEAIINSVKDEIKSIEKSMKNLDDKKKEMTEKVEEMRKEFMGKFQQKVDKKLDAIEEAAVKRKEELERKVRELTAAVAETEEALDKLKESSAEEDVESQKAVEKCRSSLTETKSADEFRVGDSVRLKMDNLSEDFLENELNHDSIGFIQKIGDKGKKCSVVFPEDSTWVGKTEQLVKSDEKHGLPQVGDTVKVKDTVKTPFFKWQESKPGSIGTLNHINNGGPPEGREVVVDFPDDHHWKGIFNELEKVPPKPLEKGDKVWLSKCAVEGLDGVKPTDVGSIISITEEDVAVKFPSCEDWKGKITDVEKVRSITVGDKVKVKDSVDEPKTGWGGIKHKDEGVVKVVKISQEFGSMALISFPKRPILWSCLISELDLVLRSGMGKPPPSSDSSSDSDIEIGGEEKCRTQ